MTVQEWETRLRARFEDSGVVGPSLLPIHHAEEAYEFYVASKFSGYRVLNQSFLEFFLKTLRTSEFVAKKTGSASRSNSYGATLLFYANIFNRFRAAEVLFLNGYPLDAFALLRDLKDRAIYLAGIVGGFTSIPALQGFDGAEPQRPHEAREQRERIVRMRREEQRRVVSLVVGKQSGLPPKVCADLRSWQGFFDAEVHLSNLTYTIESTGWSGTAPELPLGPHVEELSSAMYMNRSCEIAWLLHRTLPFLQHEAGGFKDQWAADWHLLDESIRFVVEELLKQKKDLVGSLVQLVEKKFNFDPSLCYRNYPEGRS